MKRKVDEHSNGHSNGTRKRRRSVEGGVTSSFRSGLFDEEVLNEYTGAYAASQPYNHGVIQNLIDPTVLRNVRSEIQSNLSFTPKETDIYKIHQSGDLANLSGLDDSSLGRLPSLLKLRNALYSPAFRAYISEVAGSGPLSGIKTDMAINVYTPGCHLLCHDDVIGSRRLSYILYLTNPDIPWRPEWGGALRLYPTELMTAEDGTQAKVPKAEWSVAIPPASNQLSFFAVQPGESFHDVEEVYHAERTSGNAEGDERDGGRVRMAISGWYHIPQAGEERYEEGMEVKMAEKSSLAQLQGKADQFDLPQPRCRTYAEDAVNPADLGGDEEGDPEFTEQDLEFLLEYLDPTYLTPDTIDQLRDMFEEESSLRLANFLNKKYARALKSYIESAEKEEVSVPQQDKSWGVARPPHKHRFLYRQLAQTQSVDLSAGSGSEPHSALLHRIVDSLFPSLSFKKWLSVTTGLSLNSCNVLARRFRRGLDYTLATSHEKEEPQLEVCLCITPTTGWGDDEEGGEGEAQGRGRSRGSHEKRDLASGTGAGTIKTPATDGTIQDPGPEGGVGGYELYMAGDDDNDDASSTASNHGVEIPSSVHKSRSNDPLSHTGAGKRRGGKADPAVYQEGAEEDDGVLFSMNAGWNVMSVVLRDKGVLRFVKYVSRSAKGDRWDVCGEFGVEMGEDEDEDGESDGLGDG